MPEVTRALLPSKKHLPPSTDKKLTKFVEIRKGIKEQLRIDGPKPDNDEPHACILRGAPTDPITTVNAEGESKVFTTEPGVMEDKREKQPGEEEGEVTSEARIVARVVDSNSLVTVGRFERTAHKEQEPPVERTPPTKRSMSVVDAKEVIGQGLSLKERMANLQGQVSVGSVTSPPKLMIQKPKPKLPPKPVGPPSLGEKKVPADLEIIIRSPPLDTPSTETHPEKPTELEERQHRVTAVTRVQRARTGPPVTAKKPLVRQSVIPKEEETKPGTYYTKSLDGTLLRIDGAKITRPPVAQDDPKENDEPQPEGTPATFARFHAVNKLPSRSQRFYG